MNPWGIYIFLYAHRRPLHDDYMSCSMNGKAYPSEASGFCRSSCWFSKCFSYFYPFVLYI